MAESSEILAEELASVARFIFGNPPFDTLPFETVSRLANALKINYYRKGERFVDHSDDLGGLRIIRSGAAEIRTEDGQLLDRFGEGISFNLKGLNQEQAGIYVELIEDSLIYFLEESAYQSLRKNNRDFDRFFHSQRSRRLRRAARHDAKPAEIMRPVSELMTSKVWSVRTGTSIQQTAKLMATKRVSSMLVMDDGELLGIVTDRDIRTRAVAEGIPYSEPVQSIMTANPMAITPTSSLFDAILFMTQHRIHHLPVKDGDFVKGVITASDVMLARQDDPVFLVQHITRQDDVEGLKKIVSSMPNLMVQWFKAGIRVVQISRILTAISDAVTSRLIQLAIEELGPPPVPFCWLGFGSQARKEQLIGADQDNGLLISEQATEQDLEWFHNLAHKVCDGLDACGYPYCNGKVMATTDEWRQRLSGWKATVDRWTQSPTPDAVMRVSIFFDLRAVYGDEQLADQLHRHMLKVASSNTIFLAALAENVLDTPPPLGIFRRFVVERNGEHQAELNLKKRAVIAIVDMVRLHAIANQVTAVNTHDRLLELEKIGSITKTDSRNVQDALNIVMQTRVKNQVSQIADGEDPSNYVNPHNLPTIARKQLRDAFTIIQEGQQGIKVRYRQGMG